MINSKGEEAGGERSLVLVMGGAYLLFAMMVITLIWHDDGHHFHMAW
jgi:hypothetical protein